MERSSRFIVSKSAQIACAIPCNLCDAQDAEALAFRDREGHPLQTVICRSCGLVWSDPRPVSEETDEYYRLQYRLDYKKAIEPGRRQIWRAGRGAIGRWAEHGGYLPPGARVLDVGSGGGEWLYLIMKKGCQAVGLEPNEGYALYSRREYGIEVLLGSWREARLRSGSFDAVTIHHALEHMDDPRALLVQVASWLRSEGVLAVEVPNVETIGQAPNNRFHRAHLYSFNPATLEAMGGRAGFGVIQTRVSDDQGVISTLFRNNRAPNAALPNANFGRITSTLGRQTQLSHYLSHYPYTRPLLRLARALGEHWAVRGRGSGKEILDACFARGKA
jgi:SAM-dependent methyltransferase